jgi:methylated-DNA-[protein]-cysteine S-methyltransferase
VNQVEKLKLLKEEGVIFDVKGRLVDKGQVWTDFKL